MSAERLKNIARQNWHIIVVFLFIVLFSIQFFDFIINDRSLPQSDAVSHSFITAKIYRITTGSVPADYIKTLSYPPLLYCLSAIMFRIFGVSTFALLIPLWIFCIIYLLSAFGIGSILGGRIGGLTSFLLALSGYFFIYTGERYFLDLPAAALCCASIYFLLKSDSFEKTGYTLLFGLFLGLSQLIKWNCCFFTVPAITVILITKSYSDIKQTLLPTLFSLLSVLVFFYYAKIGLFVQKNPQFENSGDVRTGIYAIILVLLLSLVFLIICRIISSKKAPESVSKLWFINYPLSIILAQIVFYPFYLNNIRAFFDQFIRQSHFTSGPGMQFSLPTNFHLLLWSFPFAGILICIGLIFSIRIFRKITDILAIMTAACAGIILVSYGAPPDYRYILPSVGLLSAIAGYWTGLCLQGSKIKYILPLIFGCMAIFPFTSYFFDFPQLKAFSHQEAFSARNLTAFIRPNIFPINKPEPDHYNFTRVIQDITTSENLNEINKDNNRPVSIETLVTKRFQQYSDNKNLPSVRNDITQYILEYHTPKGLRLTTFNRHIDENRIEIDRQSYLLIFYIDQDELENLKNSFNNNSIKPMVVSLYNLDGGRRLALIAIR